jgi:hypothetical protein
MKSVIERYNEVKEDHHAGISASAEAKVHATHGISIILSIIYELS